MPYMLTAEMSRRHGKRGGKGGMTEEVFTGMGEGKASLQALLMLCLLCLIFIIGA